MSLLNITHDIAQEHILSRLNHDDIMSYCNTHPNFRAICEDDEFWKRKLNHDLSHLNALITHVNLDPVTYATLYKNQGETWSNIYKRWENVNNDDANIYNIKQWNSIYNLNINTDIIMWFLAQNIYMIIVCCMNYIS